jgi:hypothetical protein
MVDATKSHQELKARDTDAFQAHRQRMLSEWVKCEKFSGWLLIVQYHGYHNQEVMKTPYAPNPIAQRQYIPARRTLLEPIDHAPMRRDKSHVRQNLHGSDQRKKII